MGSFVFVNFLETQSVGIQGFQGCQMSIPGGVKVIQHLLVDFPRCGFISNQTWPPCFVGVEE